MSSVNRRIISHRFDFVNVVATKRGGECTQCASHEHTLYSYLGNRYICATRDSWNVDSEAEKRKDKGMDYYYMYMVRAGNRNWFFSVCRVYRKVCNFFVMSSSFRRQPTKTNPFRAFLHASFCRCDKIIDETTHKTLAHSFFLRAK